MSLSRFDLWRAFWRSLFIQAGFSAQGLQSLGLLYALGPALEKLYPDETARRAAVERHLSTFNTHPYAAAAIVGGILHYEQRIARGEATPEDAVHFKQTLMGPLAALGDGFFWLSLRPAVGAVAVALAPAVSVWSALIFLVAYNVVHFTARGWLFILGVGLGDGLVHRVAGGAINGWAQRLRLVAATACGGTGAYLAIRFGSLQHEGHSTLLAGGSLLAGALTVWAAERHWSPYGLFYALAAVAIAMGAFT